MWTLRIHESVWDHQQLDDSRVCEQTGGPCWPNADTISPIRYRSRPPRCEFSLKSWTDAQLTDHMLGKVRKRVQFRSIVRTGSIPRFKMLLTNNVQGNLWKTNENLNTHTCESSSKRATFDRGFFVTRFSPRSLDLVRKIIQLTNFEMSDATMRTTGARKDPIFVTFYITGAFYLLWLTFWITSAQKRTAVCGRKNRWNANFFRDRSRLLRTPELSTRASHGTVAMATKWRLPMTTSRHNGRGRRARRGRGGYGGRPRGRDAVFVGVAVGQRPFWSAGGCGAGRTGRRPWASSPRWISAREGSGVEGSGRYSHANGPVFEGRSLAGDGFARREGETLRDAHRTLHWLNNTAQTRAALLKAAGAASEEPTVKFEMYNFETYSFSFDLNRIVSILCSVLHIVLRIFDCANFLIKKWFVCRFILSKILLR